MSFLNRSLRNQKGQGMMEYVLIAIVIGLIVLFVTYRFSGSLGSRFKSSRRQVDATRVDSGTNTQSQIVALEGRTDDRGEPTPAEAAAPSDGKMHVGNFAFDFTTVLWV